VSHVAHDSCSYGRDLVMTIITQLAQHLNLSKIIINVFSLSLSHISLLMLPVFFMFQQFAFINMYELCVKKKIGCVHVEIIHDSCTIIRELIFNRE